MPCVYCEMKKKTAMEWKQTGELVCYECRILMLEKEFQDKFGDEFWNMALQDVKE